MPTPYDLYLRFLVTKGVDDVEAINEQLELLNMPAVSAEDLAPQISLVDTTLPQGVKDQIEKKSYSADFLKWMKVLQVEELWHFETTPFTKDRDRKAACKLAYDINQDVQLRTTINALLIKAVPPKDIVQTVNQRFSYFLKDEHIVIYAKYFFNPKVMTRKAWREFLEECEDEDRAIYFTALTEPVEVVKTELELPSKTSSSENLQFLATKSFLMAKQFLSSRVPNGSEEARKWIDTYLKVTDKYEKYRSSDMGDFAKALQMEFDFVDTEFAEADPEVLKELSERKKTENEKKEAEEAAAAEAVAETPP